LSYNFYDFELDFETVPRAYFILTVNEQYKEDNS
jgi:hypothetical protein